MVPHRDFPTPADATTRAFLISNAVGVDAGAGGAAAVPSKRAPRFNRSSKLMHLASSTTAAAAAGGGGEAAPFIFAARSTSMVPHRDFPTPADATTCAFLLSNAVDAAGGADTDAAAAAGLACPNARSISMDPQRDFPASAAERMWAFRFWNGVPPSTTTGAAAASAVAEAGSIIPLDDNSFSNRSWNFFSALSSASLTAEHQLNVGE